MSPQYPCVVVYLQDRLSEEDWAQLEEATSCAQVVKVKVTMLSSDKALRALKARFRRNSLLTEVELWPLVKLRVSGLRGWVTTLL